uniref:Fatty acid-binding protein, adipocyte n=1 Tax=Schistocephalus solidus TaxID=70667 RepID=A0A0V0J897_SCHSO
MDRFLGTWRLERSEGFADFLGRLGVPYLICKFASMLPTTLNVTQEGDKYTVETITTFRKKTATFRLGEPFDEVSMGGTPIRSIAKLVGDVLCFEQKSVKPTSSSWKVEHNMLTTVRDSC